MEAFRQEVRDWLDANCPESMRSAGAEEETVWGGRNATFPSEAARQWLEAMGSKGWTCPTWPKEYGGGGPETHRHGTVHRAHLGVVVDAVGAGRTVVVVAAADAFAG